MTGLDLESFLLLLRADLSSWVVLGLASLGLAILVWSCWGSRRALQKCLVVSLALHLGLVLFGSTVPVVQLTVGGRRQSAADQPHIRQIHVSPLVASSRLAGTDRGMPADRSGSAAGALPPSASRRLALAAAPLRLADAALQVVRPEVANPTEQRPGVGSAPPDLAEAAPPSVRNPASEPAAAQPFPELIKSPGGIPPTPLPPNLAEVDPDGAGARTQDDRPGRVGPARSDEMEHVLGSRDRSLRADPRLRPPAIADGTEHARLQFSALPVPGPARPGPRDLGHADATAPAPARSDSDVGSTRGAVSTAGGPISLEHATPRGLAAIDGAPGIAALDIRRHVRSLADIPKVYQPRLDPNRPTQAERAGASKASELAVERALDWLARHQDRDGRWDAAIARYDDGTPAQDDDDFTAHCPVGDTCFGECAYWEADSALTGLALLTYLGAGYTHTQGRYTETVGKGFDFLIRQQKPDGDLRGRSRVVGMYCHAMATLALCEGYALTGDPRLRGAAGRAVAFVVGARARDGLAWRYAPGAPVGDTSILGWVVMGLKSAREAGIPIPDDASVRRGTLNWLEKVAAGQAKGLARYQPWDPVTPTMTAEAWVCRQFLGDGGPGPASVEAAEFLLRNQSDRGPTNVYYWYYATLALYQYGGESWSRWNAMIRDRIVGLQRTSGHPTGSWDPDESLYGSKGGRIYCTTLAAMTLEVYYRYLRLYDEPSLPLEPSATPDGRPGRDARPEPATAQRGRADR
jgi:hypothetical protein